MAGALWCVPATMLLNLETLIKQVVILVACIEQFDVQVFKKPASDSDKYLTKLVNIMKENPHITGAMHQPIF